MLYKADLHLFYNNIVLISSGAKLLLFTLVRNMLIYTFIRCKEDDLHFGKTVTLR